MASSAPVCPDAWIDLAHRLADAAGAVLRRYFRSSLAVDDKTDSSPVTEADRGAERAMRALIAEACPGHGILGEEYGAENADAEWVWVLDPLDGTKAFITGKPSFGILIALVHRGVSVLGVIDQPILKERWLGVAARPTTLNGAPIHVRACPNLASAALYATAPDMFVGADARAFHAMSGKVKLLRYGADCYAYGLLASGFVDLVVEASLKPYDYLAMVPVIEGAGGTITDWQGKALGLGSDGRVVAAGDVRAASEARASLRL
jgi:inositol-phosphate phosphatase/L-galactose 1-phosphate phosphatase/histidinol-phosphatase